MMNYSVSLANESAIFDNGEFETAKEAIKWSLGRGGDYIAYITKNNAEPGVKVCVKNGKLLVETGWKEYEAYTPAELARYLGEE